MTRDFLPQVMGAISWIVDSLLYDEAIAVAEEEQRLREREATPEQREQDKEDGVDDQVQRQGRETFVVVVIVIVVVVVVVDDDVCGGFSRPAD